MEFTLKINCDNEAFDGLLLTELQRILRKIASRLEDYGRADLEADRMAVISTGKYQNVFDVNGNIVGTWRLK